MRERHCSTTEAMTCLLNSQIQKLIILPLECCHQNNSLPLNTRIVRRCHLPGRFDLLCTAQVTMNHKMRTQIILEIEDWQTFSCDQIVLEIEDRQTLYINGDER